MNGMNFSLTVLVLAFLLIFKFLFCANYSLVTKQRKTTTERFCHCGHRLSWSVSISFHTYFDPIVYVLLDFANETSCSRQWNISWPPIFFAGLFYGHSNMVCNIFDFVWRHYRGLWSSRRGNLLHFDSVLHHLRHLLHFLPVSMDTYLRIKLIELL